jgi:2-haloacid dehalogenase
MILDRRRFLAAGAGVATLSGLSPAAADPKYKAIVFDAFPIFDARSVAALCESAFPGRGDELVNLWRTRQFEYAWLRALSGRYADFATVTEASLVFSAKALKLDLTDDKREHLSRAYFELQPWPDAKPALAKLKDLGLRLAILSNFTPVMLTGCIKASGFEGVFDKVLSTDLVKTYKPDVRAYQVGVDALNLPREEILFVAFAGWDAAGTKSMGYPTFWVNRLGLLPEELGATPDGSGAGLAELLAFIG